MHNSAFIINNCILFKEELFMATEQLAKSIDFIWDGWLNSFKVAQQVQDELESKTVQAFTYQKAVVDSTVSAVRSLEQQSNQMASDWKDKTQQTLKELNTNGQLDQLNKWLDNVQDITDKVQEIAWKPNQLIIDLFTQSQEQFENSVKNVLDFQKQEREETLKKITELTEQLKQAQKELLTAK